MLKYNITIDYTDIKNLNNLSLKIKALPQNISTPIKANGIKNIMQYLRVCYEEDANIRRRP
jgi:hypothetical protein